MQIKTPKWNRIHIDQWTIDLLKEIYFSQEDGIRIKWGSKTHAENIIMNNNLAVYCAKEWYLYQIASYNPFG